MTGGRERLWRFISTIPIIRVRQEVAFPLIPNYHPPAIGRQLMGLLHWTHCDNKTRLNDVHAGDPFKHSPVCSYQSLLKFWNRYKNEKPLYFRDVITRRFATHLHVSHCLSAGYKTFPLSPRQCRSPCLSSS